MLHRTTAPQNDRLFRVIGAVLFLTTGGLHLSCSKDKSRDHDDSEIRPIHTIDVDGMGGDLATDANLLAVSAKNKGIYVFDVSTPARPQEIVALDLPYVYRTVVQDNTIFGFDEHNGLSFIDLTNINGLQLTQSLSTSELYGYISDAIWVDDTLFFASESIGLSAYAVSAEFSLTGGKIDTKSEQSATSLASIQNRLVAASFRGEINVYEKNVVPDQKLTAINGLLTGHRVSDLTCNDMYCYTAALSEGLFVYSIDEAGKPVQQSQTDLGDVIEFVHIDEGLLYASFRGPTGKNGWYVFDLIDAANPKVVRKIMTGSQIKDFTRVGEVTYVLLVDGQIELYERGSLQ